MSNLCCGFTPMLCGSKAIKLVQGKTSQITKVYKSQRRKKESNEDDSPPLACNFILMMEFRKKIITFRDIIDLPPCNTSLSTEQMIIRTMRDLHKFYPESIPRYRRKKFKRLPLDKVLIYFCKALQDLANISKPGDEGVVPFKFDVNENEDCTNVEKLVEVAVAKLNGLIKIAREKSDLNNEDEESKGLSQKANNPYFEKSYGYPSPTSVLPEFMNSSPLLVALNVQAVGKLSPNYLKQLKFDMLPEIEKEDPSFLKQNKIKIEEQNEEENGDVVDETNDSISQNETLDNTSNDGATDVVQTKNPLSSTTSTEFVQLLQEKPTSTQAAIETEFVQMSEYTSASPRRETSTEVVEMPEHKPTSLPPLETSAKVVQVGEDISASPLQEMPTKVVQVAEDISISPPQPMPITVLSTIPPPPPLPTWLQPNLSSRKPPIPPLPQPLLNAEAVKSISVAKETELPSPNLDLAKTTSTRVSFPPPPPPVPSKPNSVTTLAPPPLAPPVMENVAPISPPPPPVPLKPNSVATLAPPVMENLAPISPPPPAVPSKTNSVATVAPPPLTPSVMENVTPISPPPPPVPSKPNSAATLAPPPPQKPSKPNSAATLAPPPLAPPVMENVARISPPPPPPPPLRNASGTTPPPPPPKSASRTSQPPPLPMPLKGSGPMAPPPPPGSSTNGAAPPPPPPGTLRSKKTNSKLKRSSKMGNLYRNLKGKVEGVPTRGPPSSNGKKSGGGNSGGGKQGQGMADALAEMTKRSTYFIQIEEDVEKYEKSIKELRTSISTFKTSDMLELFKFHKYVESILENLTDETQVLARFEGFPEKKLEALRTASTLYSKLESMLIELQNWKSDPPLAQLIDRVERYFDKIKKEIDSLERTKDDQSKQLKGHNIDFDFQILVRIKEAMVDLSSNIMELAMKERREAKLGNAQKKVDVKLLWRAFQFAFRVYTFAGGHDERADKLTQELAHEIETDPEHQQ